MSQFVLYISILCKKYIYMKNHCHEYLFMLYEIYAYVNLIFKKFLCVNHPRNEVYFTKDVFIIAFLGKFSFCCNLFWDILKKNQFKRTVARSHCNARRASRARRTRQVNLSKLLTALSAIAAPSAGTIQNLCTFLVRVPALGVAMVESAVNKV